jgi:C-terminal processing protease CtpA/Prc
MQGFGRRDSLSEDEERELVECLADDNFGFTKIERLSGNVGYLDLRNFHDATWAGRTAVAAMNFLANSDALIIDLRNNGGGEPSMIQLISSYFFKEPVHLNSFYIRDEDRTQQFWSHAHVEGPRMTDIPLYVLTSCNTFSAAEEFTYNMKNLGRATIVGETTGGGAHPVRFVRFSGLKVGMSLPFGRAINPVTNSNWEGTGVEPDIEVPRDEALNRAHLEALRLLVDREGTEEKQRDLHWAIGAVEATMSPPDIRPEIMKSYAGVYGPRRVTYENGALFYQREGNPRIKMIPMSDDTFMFDELEFFRIEVETDTAGNPTCLVGHYANGFTDRTPRSDEQGR